MYKLTVLFLNTHQNPPLQTHSKETSLNSSTTQVLDSWFIALSVQIMAMPHGPKVNDLHHDSKLVAGGTKRRYLGLIFRRNDLPFHYVNRLNKVLLQGG